MSAMLKEPFNISQTAQSGVIDMQDLRTLCSNNTVYQGDWAFVPAPHLQTRNMPLILRNEPIRHGEQNGHICEQLVRFVGGRIYVHPQWAPDGIHEKRYQRWISRNPQLAEGWSVHTPGQQIFVKGVIENPIFGYLALEGWHRAIPTSN